MTGHCLADSLGVGDRESREVTPANVYDDRHGAQRYDAARALPAATLALWMHTLQQFIPQPPEACAVEQHRMPSRQAMIDQLTAHAYDFVVLHTVWQAFASSAGAYYDKIAQRGLSSLISISDGAFASGLQRLRVWANAQPGHVPVYEPVDVFVFAAA
jgi:hypothetical protein